jgi:single-stranded DNA-specific DHH superfamily exonuclease
MGLTENQMKELKDVFDNSHRPVILFDDDADGLASFLMIYKHIGEGKGIPVKNAPELGPELARKVEDYAPDIVIIVDVPIVSQDFIDQVKSRIVWLDHHPLVERRGVNYFNPRQEDPCDNRPTSYWVYRVLRENLWIAMTGIIGDWFMPEHDIISAFNSAYPRLLSSDVKRPEVALHDSRLGELIRIISFNLKGKASDVIKSVKVMTRIQDPEEILSQTTAGGTFIFKKYYRLKDKYEQLMKQPSINPKDDMIVFIYKSPDYSFSAELSNELIYRHPDKVILIAWEYDGEYKCSLRSTKVKLPQLIEKSLEDVNGYGGGHDHAAGACIKIADFDRFVENIRRNLASE